ncbi:MAG: hypothetical protein PWQ82_1611 [Thermosediminibacterales bacterium]|nr:hypothetical protein [Thermosediminibacterales bacterium]MDK2836288.1 hypothetical protein [Thermosediminibacterales bacterium]
MKKKLRLFICLSLLFLFLMSSNAIAADRNILQRQDTVVPQGQIVENVVVIGADATIYGSVSDAVIVINGDLDIKHSAQIAGPILVVGGNIDQEQGAQIRENVFNITFDEATKNSLLIAVGLLLGIWLLKLGLSLIMAILTVITTVLIRKQIEPFTEMIRQSPGRVILIGFVTSLFLIAASILLAITIIGIPLVAIIAIISLLFLLVTIAVCSLIIGEHFFDTIDYPLWQVATVGGVIIIAAFNIPLLGGLFFLALIWLSMGLMTLWLWGKVKGKKRE